MCLRNDLTEPTLSNFIERNLRRARKYLSDEDPTFGNFLCMLGGKLLQCVGLRKEIPKTEEYEIIEVGPEVRAALEEVERRFSISSPASDQKPARPFSISDCPTDYLQ